MRACCGSSVWPSSGAVRCSDLALDQRLDDAPAEIGGEQDDGGVEQTAQKQRDCRIGGFDRPHVEAPGAGEQVSRQDDERHADAAIDHGHRYRRNRLGVGVALGRPKDIVDGAMRHDDGSGQRHRRDREPEEDVGAADADHQENDKIRNQQTGCGRMADARRPIPLRRLIARPQPNGRDG